MPLMQRPYPEWVNLEFELPRGYRIPEFTKFTGDDDQRPVDHLARVELQCGDVWNNDLVHGRLFPHSLADSALEWYNALQPNSIQNWVQMRQGFYFHFHRTCPEVTVVDLYQTVQKPGETVEQYLIRFKRVRSRCKGSLGEEDVVKIAIAGIRNYEIRKQLSGKNLRDFHVLYFKAVDFERVQKGNETDQKQKLGSPRTKTQKSVTLDTNGSMTTK